MFLVYSFKCSKVALSTYIYRVAFQIIDDFFFMYHFIRIKGKKPFTKHFNHLKIVHISKE